MPEIGICLWCGNPVHLYKCTVTIAQSEYEPVAVKCRSCGTDGTVIIIVGSFIWHDGAWKCAKCSYIHDKVEQEIAENAIADFEESADV